MPNVYNSWRTGVQIDNIYPVGSIYMSINNTDPGTLFGGTWEQIEDTFLLCAGSTYAGGSTGGSASSAHTHTQVAITTGGPSNNTSGSTAITIAQMPSHNHNSRSLTGSIVSRKYGASASYLWLPGGDGVNTSGIVTRSKNHSSGASYVNASWGSSGYIDLYTINATHTHDSQGSGSGHTHTLSSHTHTTAETTTGAASNENNMPPYLAVYVFKRVA